MGDRVRNATAGRFERVLTQQLGLDRRQLAMPVDDLRLFTHWRHAASQSAPMVRAAGTVITGHGARRTTRSATLPITTRFQPWRPCVPQMTRFTSLLVAYLRIWSLASPHAAATTIRSL